MSNVLGKCPTCGGVYLYDNCWPHAEDGISGLYFCMECNSSTELKGEELWPKRFKMVNEGGSSILDIKVRLTKGLVAMSQGGSGGDIYACLGQSSKESTSIGQKTRRTDDED